jgi:hypothetical protein
MEYGNVNVKIRIPYFRKFQRDRKYTVSVQCSVEYSTLYYYFIYAGKI